MAYLSAARNPHQSSNAPLPGKHRKRKIPLQCHARLASVRRGCRGEAKPPTAAELARTFRAFGAARGIRLGAPGARRTRAWVCGSPGAAGALPARAVSATCRLIPRTSRASSASPPWSDEIPLLKYSHAETYRPRTSKTSDSADDGAQDAGELSAEAGKALYRTQALLVGYRLLPGYDLTELRFGPLGSLA